MDPIGPIPYTPGSKNKQFVYFFKDFWEVFGGYLRSRDRAKQCFRFVFCFDFVGLGGPGGGFGAPGGGVFSTGSSGGLPPLLPVLKPPPGAPKPPPGPLKPTKTKQKTKRKLNKNKV